MRDHARHEEQLTFAQPDDHDIAILHSKRNLNPWLVADRRRSQFVASLVCVSKSSIRAGGRQRSPRVLENAFKVEIYIVLMTDYLLRLGCMYATRVLATSGVRQSFIQPRVLATRSWVGSFSIRRIFTDRPAMTCSCMYYA